MYGEGWYETKRRSCGAFKKRRFCAFQPKDESISFYVKSISGYDKDSPSIELFQNWNLDEKYHGYRLFSYYRDG